MRYYLLGHLRPPQLGGGGPYFDPAYRLSGFHSLSLRRPIVPTETLNAVRARTRGLAAAGEEIRQRTIAF